MPRRQAVVRPTCADAPIAPVEGEAPMAIQVEPLRPLEIGTWMLGQRDGVARRALRGCWGVENR